MVTLSKTAQRSTYCTIFDIVIFYIMAQGELLRLLGLQDSFIKRVRDRAGTYTQEWWSLKFVFPKLIHRPAAWVSHGKLVEHMQGLWKTPWIRSLGWESWTSSVLKASWNTIIFGEIQNNWNTCRMNCRLLLFYEIILTSVLVTIVQRNRSIRIYKVGEK